MGTYSFLVTFVRRNDEFWEERDTNQDHEKELSEIIQEALHEYGFPSDEAGIRFVDIKDYPDPQYATKDLPDIPRGMISESLPSEVWFRGVVSQVKNGWASVDLTWFQDHEEDLKRMPHVFSVYGPHVQVGDTIEATIRVVV